MTFVGFLLFLDPIKAEIMTTIADLDRLGICIKIVTGDNRFVAAHVAEAIGLHAKALLTGEQLHRDERRGAVASRQPHRRLRRSRSAAEGAHRARATARRPCRGLSRRRDKRRALYEADVGISVDRAVDVARESADIVLLRRDLDALRAGVEDGRRTFANTLKYIRITTSADFGNMISMALATLFLPFLPLLPKQILLNNFLSDFPAIIISTDNVDREQTDKCQRWDIREVRSFMLVFGLASTAFDLVTFAVLLLYFKVNEVTFQTTWFVVSLLTELAVLLVLRTRGPLRGSRPCRLLILATLATALVALALPYTGAAARVFDLVPLPFAIVVAAMLIVAAYVATTEALKLRFYRREWASTRGHRRRAPRKAA